MDEKRKGEIAFSLLKCQVSREGIRLNPVFLKRDLGNLAKETGIPQDELMDFVKILIKELIEDIKETFN